jgi:DNA-binding response OmpR family regulator
VTTAANGAIALQLAREERFDLVISDIMMPVMDGPTLVAALRALPGGDTLPVLFASARGELQDRVDGLGQADDYLPKPFQAPELVARAVALLRRSRLPSREGAPADREQAALLDKLAATADPRLGEPDFSVGALAKAMAMSPRTLQLRMAAVDLPPPRDWLRVRRLERARALIRSGEVGAVAEAADAVGLSRSYFTRAYAAHFGQSPGEALRAG